MNCLKPDIKFRLFDFVNSKWSNPLNLKSSKRRKYLMIFSTFLICFKCKKVALLFSRFHPDNIDFIFLLMSKVLLYHLSMKWYYSLLSLCVVESNVVTLITDVILIIRQERRIIIFKCSICGMFLFIIDDIFKVRDGRNDFLNCTHFKIFLRKRLNVLPSIFVIVC